MLRDVAVARIQRGLGFRTDQADNIVLALQEAQRLLERGRTLPYFLHSGTQTISVVAQTSAYSLPERFLREHEDASLRYVASSGGVTYLKKIMQKDSHYLFWDDQAYERGDPTAYALFPTTVNVYPVPNRALTLIWNYYQGAVPLTTNIENAWLEEEYGAPEVLIGRAGALIAEDLGNNEAYAKFGRMFQEAWNGMLGDTFQRAEENMPLRMGERL